MIWLSDKQHVALWRYSRLPLSPWTCSKLMHPHTSIFLHTTVCVYIHISICFISFFDYIRPNYGRVHLMFEDFVHKSKSYTMPKGEIRDREKIADNGGLGVGRVDMTIQWRWIDGLLEKVDDFKVDRFGSIQMCWYLMVEVEGCMKKIGSKEIWNLRRKTVRWTKHE